MATLDIDPNDKDQVVAIEAILNALNEFAKELNDALNQFMLDIQDVEIDQE